MDHIDSGLGDPKCVRVLHNAFSVVPIAVDWCFKRSVVLRVACKTMQASNDHHGSG
jgi:hypothetical protein